MDTDSNVNPTDRPHTVCPAEEMELSDIDQCPTSADIVQALSDTDSNVNPADRPHTVCPAEEMELSDLDQGPTSADIDQVLSEEQTYRDNERGNRLLHGLEAYPQTGYSHFRG